MKKICVFIMALALAFSALCAGTAFAASGSEYESDKLGFSISLPETLAQDVEIQETADGICFVHKPSVEGNWTGKLFSIEVVSPKSKFFTDKYCGYGCQIVAANSESAWVCVSNIGGVDSGEAHRADYEAAMQALGGDFLEKNLKIDNPQEIPEMKADKLSKLIAEMDKAPKKTIKRYEAAQMILELIRPETFTAREITFEDVKSSADYAQAVAYLADFGVISGYPDGSFKPKAAITRAEFAAMLNRALLMPFPLWYGDEIKFDDVKARDWSWNYLNYASQAGWLAGNDKNELRPNEKITKAEAASALGCVAEGLKSA